MSNRISQYKYPHLWRGCVGAWCPSKDQWGSNVLRDFSGVGNHGEFTGMSNNNMWSMSNQNLTIENDLSVTKRIEIRNTLRNMFSSQVASLSMWVRSDVADNGAWTINSNLPSYNHYPYSGFIYDSTFNSVRFTITPVSSVDMTKLHHVAIVRTPTLWTMFQKAIVAHSASPNTWMAPSSIINFLTSTRADLTYFAFDGAMDDIRLYNRALPISEISTLAQRCGIAYDINVQRPYGNVAAPSGGSLILPRGMDGGYSFRDFDGGYSG